MSAKCTNEETGKMLHAFELGALSRNDSILFENHILECNSCFEELKSFEEETGILRSNENLKESINTNDQNNVRQLSLKKRPEPQKDNNFTHQALLVAVVLLLIPAAIGIFYILSPDVKTVQSIILVPTRSVEYNTTLTEYDVALTFYIPEVKSDVSYTLNLFLDGKSIVTFEDYTNFDDFQNGTIVIPRDKLQTGQYELQVKEPGRDKIQQTYYFNLE